MKIDVKGSVTRKEAMKLLLDKWAPEAKVEIIPLEESLNRILAEDVYSHNTLPVVRSSKADGIAVKSSEFNNGVPNTSKWTLGVDYVRADTGDDFDDAFDAVIPIENVSFNENGRITISSDAVVKKGSSINPSGHLVRKDELLAKENTCIRAIHLAILATGGVRKVPVLKKPLVAYIPTGNELINPFNKPKRGENIESNGLMIEAMLKELGADVMHFPIIRDNMNELNNALEKALESCDIVLINGGSSKGDEDYNTRLLKSRGILLQHCVLAGPGRPIGIAIENNIPVINVPGPTIGAFYAMDWCVSKLVTTLLEKPDKTRETVNVTLLNDASTPSIFEFFLRLKVYKQNGQYVAKALTWDDGTVEVLLNANAICISPIGVSGYKKGQVLEAQLLYGQEEVSELK